MNSQLHHPLTTDSGAKSSFSILPPKQVGNVVPLQIAANEHENAFTKHTLDHLGYGIAAEAYPKDPDLRRCFEIISASFCAEAISDYTNQSEVFQSVRSFLAPTKHRAASLARFVVSCMKVVREHGTRWNKTERDQFVTAHPGCRRIPAPAAYRRRLDDCCPSPPARRDGCPVCKKGRSRLFSAPRELTIAPGRSRDPS